MGKHSREHFEVINHNEAISYVEELVSRKEELSEKVIKDIHTLILKNIDDQNAGRYRNMNAIYPEASITHPISCRFQERWRSCYSGIIQTKINYILLN